jgi:hypothetical protein
MALHFSSSLQWSSKRGGAGGEAQAIRFATFWRDQAQIVILAEPRSGASTPIPAHENADPLSGPYIAHYSLPPFSYWPAPFIGLA